MQSEARPDKVLDVHVAVDTLVTNTKSVWKVENRFGFCY